jgi:uridine kinase
MSDLPATITVSFPGGHKVECPRGTVLRDLLPAPASLGGAPCIAARVNNAVASLSYPIEIDCEVEWLTREDPDGWIVYQHSGAFLVAMAVRELFPQATFSVDYSLGDGLYCTFESPAENGARGITPDQLARLDARLRELVARRVPIERRKIAFTEAVRRFTEAGQTDALHLLKYRNPPRVVIHYCQGFYDLAQGPLAPDTGALDCFELVPYAPHFVLYLAGCGKDRPREPFRKQPHLFQIFQEHKEWGRILGVTTVGRLNEIVASGRIGEFVKIAEALHEKKVARIADQIAGQAGRVRFVLIAGPSSAGKTTFAKRLAIQLRVNGLRPELISLDDYFLEPAQTPRDAEGRLDYEHLNALDLELFNRHLLEIAAGREVELPRYNFAAKKREFRGDRLRAGPDQPVILEGIHGLNPELTRDVPAEFKFGIYISALTQLNLDACNRISTTDNRLIRRIVRDHKYRGHSALNTIALWPSVRRGEERWVFPFQQLAHATFNSALDYELAVLKPLVEPLLMQIKPSHREYAVCRRLTAFLLNFLAVPEQEVPSNSILREYIGSSSFQY